MPTEGLHHPATYINSERPFAEVAEVIGNVSYVMQKNPPAAVMSATLVKTTQGKLYLADRRTDGFGRMVGGWVVTPYHSIADVRKNGRFLLESCDRLAAEALA